MKLRLTRKILFLFLTVCTVFLVIFAEPLIADGHDHDCTGKDCPVCARIEAAQYFLKTLKLAGMGMLGAICPLFPAPVHKKYTCSPIFFSPVTLKVRFNS